MVEHWGVKSGYTEARAETRAYTVRWVDFPLFNEFHSFAFDNQSTIYNITVLQIQIIYMGSSNLQS